jgi:hypothetical protein
MAENTSACIINGNVINISGIGPACYPDIGQIRGCPVLPENTERVPLSSPTVLLTVD